MEIKETALSKQNKEKLDKNDLSEYNHLIDQWADVEYGEIPENFFGKMNSVYQISSDINQKIEEVLPELTNHSYYQNYLKRELYKQSLLTEVKAAKLRGDLIDIREGGKVIGMTLVTPCTIAEPNNLGITGKACFPMRVIIDKPHRRNRKMTELRAKTIDHIREKYGNIPILSCTRELAIKRLNKKFGYTQISSLDFEKLNPNNSLQEAMKKAKGLDEGRYETYILIPAS